MAEGVMAVINTIICVFRYNGSIPSEKPVVLSERICASPSMQVSQQNDPPEPDSEKKNTQTHKCPVSILDSRRKHFESVDLSKRKTFVPESKAAIQSVIPQAKASSKDVSDDKSEGGSQGILVFTLWYIFIAYSYARGYLPAQMPPDPAAPPGKSGKGGPPPPAAGGASAAARQADNLSTAGPTEVQPPVK